MTSFAELEAHVDRALRDLPWRQAPGTLLPRVMAAVHAWGARPWYERAWVTWPLQWQALSGAFLAALLVAGVWLLPVGEARLASAASALAGGPMADLTSAAARIERTTDAALLVWRTLVRPVVPVAFALTGSMLLASAALVMLLNRLVLGRAVPR
jgi:hypothetical protein